MGNSEVGHLNLGAGAVVKQDLMRIDEAVEDGSLAENEVILEALRDAPRVHLIGLVSDGGVHSSDRHLKALIELAAQEGVEDLVIHAFTDGRDTSPKSRGEDARDGAGVVRGGRRRPDRLGDRALLRDGPRHALGPHREGRRAAAARQGRARGGVRRGGRARQAYERDETDEFITATKVGDEDATIRDGDSVLAFNFRPDRMRQITQGARRGRRRPLRAA